MKGTKDLTWATFSRRSRMATQFSVKEEGVKLNHEGEKGSNVEVDLTWAALAQAFTNVASLIHHIFGVGKEKKS